MQRKIGLRKSNTLSAGDPGMRNLTDEMKQWQKNELANRKKICEAEGKSCNNCIFTGCENSSKDDIINKEEMK